MGGFTDPPSTLTILPCYCWARGIRTPVLRREQIYSLSPLTTRPPLNLVMGVGFEPTQDVSIHCFKGRCTTVMLPHNIRADGGTRTHDVWFHFTRVVLSPLSHIGIKRASNQSRTDIPYVVGRCTSHCAILALYKLSLPTILLLCHHLSIGLDTRPHRIAHLLGLFELQPRKCKR